MTNMLEGDDFNVNEKIYLLYSCDDATSPESMRLSMATTSSMCMHNTVLLEIKNDNMMYNDHWRDAGAVLFGAAPDDNDKYIGLGFGYDEVVGDGVLQ